MEITFLGTGGAVPSDKRTNTSIWVENQGTALLIDCSGDIFHKILKYKLRCELLDYVIITHGHIDHTYGLASLIETLRLSGRKREIHLHICEDTFERQYKILQLYNLLHRPEGFPIVFHTIPLVKDYHMLSTDNLDIFTTPVKHSVPNIAVRICEGPGSMTYSSDTEPFEDFVDFAMNSDVLVHECMSAKWLNKPLKGHSMACDVGRIAQKACAKNLYPVHLAPELDKDIDRLKREIAEEFSGQIVIPDDGFKISLKDDKIDNN